MKHIIKKFQPESGYHCITTSLKQIFHYYGHQISEEMLFGLASGLNFIYFEIKNVPFPIIGGRSKIQTFEDTLAEHLNIDIEFHKTNSSKKAYKELVKLIKTDIPLMVYVDMAFLKYLQLPEEAHFGGHSIVVFGIDEKEIYAFISDRDAKDFPITYKAIPDDFHIIPLEELEKARGSKHKPYPPKNQWLTFDFKNINNIDKDIIYKAIGYNIEMMLAPPIKNLGVKGINLFSEKILEWKKFDAEKLKLSALNSFIMINQIGGNGGGIFRRIYANFLKESADIVKSKELGLVGDDYLELAEEWDEIGNIFYEIYENGNIIKLDIIAENLKEIYNKEIQLMNDLQIVIK